MEHMAESPLPQDDPVLTFYFEALQFMRLAEQFGSHALFDVTLSDVGVASAKLVIGLLPTDHRIGVHVYIVEAVALHQHGGRSHLPRRSTICCKLCASCQRCALA